MLGVGIIFDKNHLEALLPNEKRRAAQWVKVISIPAESRGRSLEIDMNGERALAYFAAGSR